MAALMRKCMKSVQKNALFGSPIQGSCLKVMSRCTGTHKRNSWNTPPPYDNTKYDSVEVGLSPDGSTVVCWHPEPKFPYEYTQPLPRKDPSTFEVSIKSKNSDSPLRVQHVMDEHYQHRLDGPTDSELSEMFRTTKHTWYPKPQRKYIKPNPPKDRDGL